MELDLDHLEKLIPRYDVAGPRYTSYPTAPVWKEDFGDEAYGRALEQVAPGADLSLYVHVPFCESLCHYCACNKVITRKAELPVRYLEVIAREIEATRQRLRGDPRAVELHWGGGTPTHLTPEQIRTLFDAITSAIPLHDDAEVSIEVDPRVTTVDHMDVLAECGFNRISLGVQDFDARVQESVHRVQPVDQVEKLVVNSRERGFRSINFDLIYGLPYQTEDSFSRTLDTVLDLAPDRIALYSYAHVTWVAKQQRSFERSDLPEPARKLRIMLMAIRRFLEAGYVYIGMDHFARPEDDLSRALADGRLYRNFMGYTIRAGGELVGFGPSAISELEDSYAQSQRGLGEWEQAVEERGLATLRGHRLSADDLARRWVIQSIMCQGVVEASVYEARFGEPFAKRYAKEIQRLAPMAEDGLIVVEADGSLRVTSDGRLLVRNAAMAFDAYLEQQTRGDKPLFSKTV
ncbi:MAG: oxygen-independent coproporphyrinogen III oxidase [Deltaproteobacteria bacterium]|nr:oxygen-independent coproporphyrinogen III oxidase [Deltaproteobacteria bacterium]MBW2419323.1 oxygen-independent coproporphyrinogen III oxidase [Deltaproteobacteria bacterium]